MIALKYLSILPFVIGLTAAANCYTPDTTRLSSILATDVFNELTYNSNFNRKCVSSGSCVACYRAPGSNYRFDEAKNNIKSQCLGSGTTYKQGYWEASGLRVCYDCVNSGNCNSTNM
ncbi:hypothetical protein AA313_de0200636 [Arthrobotrys entomopaga]|nr:hypothetical protein AA313_de0200636 [Arthrobotrys entomopaga]